MRRLRQGTTLAGGVAGALMLAAAGFADTPASKWYDAIAIGGHVQGSYVGALGKDTPQQNQLRVYDQNNGFNLNQAQLRITKPLGDDGFGFSIKLLAGHDAGYIHSAGLGSTNDFDVEEAYVSMAAPKLKSLTITGGKFVTACGVEVIESPSNMNIAPGYLFFYGMPFTHTGVKAAYTVNDKATVMAGLANGWDQVVDGNPGKTIIWQFATTPMKGLTANLSGSYGPELFNNYPTGTPGVTNNVPASGNLNISKRTHLDAVLGYTGIDKLSLNLEGLWGQDTNIGGVDDSGTSHWTGLGLWAGYSVSDYVNPGVRFEVFDDQNNAARLGGPNQTAKEFTIGNKFVTSKSTFVRLEYRHDWSNEGAFKRDDGTAVTNQNTIGLDYVVTF